MTAFPNIQKPDYGGYSEGTYVPFKKTEFEGNAIAVRRGGIVARRTFALSWRSLPQADYTTLKTFFAANAGTAFDFTPHGEINPVKVTFSDTRLSFTAQAFDGSSSGSLRWKGTVNLEEVKL